MTHPKNIHVIGCWRWRQVREISGYFMDKICMFHEHAGLVTESSISETISKISKNCFLMRYFIFSWWILIFAFAVLADSVLKTISQPEVGPKYFLSISHLNFVLEIVYLWPIIIVYFTVNQFWVLMNHVVTDQDHPAMLQFPLGLLDLKV